jgi:hypothetical protein
LFSPGIVALYYSFSPIRVNPPIVLSFPSAIPFLPPSPRRRRLLPYDLAGHDAVVLYRTTFPAPPDPRRPVPPRNPSGASGCWSSFEEHPPGAGPRSITFISSASSSPASALGTRLPSAATWPPRRASAPRPKLRRRVPLQGTLQIFQGRRVPLFLAPRLRSKIEELLFLAARLRSILAASASASSPKVRNFSSCVYCSSPRTRR